MDLIDRKEAIYAVMAGSLSAATVFGRTEHGMTALKETIRAIKELPSAHPTDADCWGCNCPKMERSKEQKTFSEMVRLHDTETHDKRTETHACDLISRMKRGNRNEAD